MKTLPSTPRLVVFLLFLFVCLFILYFGFGNRSVPLTSKSHALKDNNPPMTEGAGVALDKERKVERQRGQVLRWTRSKDAPQKEVREEKKVGSKKRSSRRKKRERKERVNQKVGNTKNVYIIKISFSFRECTKKILLHK